MLSDYVGYARQRIVSLASTTPQEALATRASERQLTISHALSSALAALSRVRECERPTLVVMGTQSSGKSSLLNALIGVQLLPTGETMTTRAAIEVQLVNTAARDGSPRARVEFGNYDGGEWSAAASVELDDPPAAAQQEAVQRNIATQTERLLAEGGGGRGIVTGSSLMVRLYSPSVPNMSFVDLPGITMTALTSEGQPADICAQIRELIRAHCASPRATILLVCAARPDLEADAAVEFCRSLTGGARVVGCLTKPDLCEPHTGMLPYLTGTCAPDLRFEHGYFAVRCRVQPGETMQELYAEERAFLAGTCLGAHPTRVGTLQLGAFLQDLLARVTVQLLPALREELQQLRARAREEYGERLREPVPESPANQLAFVNEHIHAFVRHLHDSVTARKPDHSTGRELRHIFGALRAEVRDCRPFEALDDEEILRAVRNSEGISMMSPVPPVEIVEFFMQHASHRPIQQLFDPCVAATTKVHDHIRAEALRIATQQVGRFERLQTWLIAQVERIQREEITTTSAALHELLHIEESYVFSDNASFLAQWHEATQRCTARVEDYPCHLRSILDSYFGVVANHVAHAAPKLVLHGARRMLRQMSSCLTGLLHEMGDVATLLFESEEIERLRSRLTQTIATADACLRTVDEALGGD